MYVYLLTNFLIFIILVCLVDFGFSMGFKSQPQKELWKQVPLRSSAQKEAGIMGGEGMQMIFGIAVAPSNPTIVYLVSNTSQVWKSIDSGSSWRMMHKGFLSNGGIAVSVDPVNENIVFVAGSLGSPLRSSPTDGIYRTIDGGESWKLVKPTPFFSAKEGEHFVFDLKSSDGSRTKIIYAGTHKDGLLISKDGGDNWEMLGFKGERILDMKLNPINPSILYLLTIKGLFKVTIENYTISQVERLGKDLIGNFKTFALNLKNPLIIYIAMGEAGVYKSSDGGKKFFRLRKGLPGNLDYTQIAISPVNPDYLYVSVHKSAKLNPFWSHDGGESWHSPTTLDKDGLSFVGEHRWFSGCIEPHPRESNIALTAANGKARVLKTDDGGISWFYSGNGYTGGRKSIGKTSHVFYQDPKKMIFFLIDHGPALTEDGGDTFRMLPVPRVKERTTPVGAVESITDGKIIVTAVGGWNRQVLIVSGDGGNTWGLIPGTDDKYRFIAFHPQKPDIIYAQGWTSKDRGKSWKPLPKKVYAMFQGNGDIVYSIDEFEKNKSVIRRSNDQGKTWITPYPYLSVKMRSIYEIDIAPLNSNYIYVASQSGLYIYDDKSKKWLKKGEESGLTKDRFGLLSVKNVVVDLRHPEVVYAGRWAPGMGHSNGIFRSDDYGKTWENITFNLGPEITVWSVSVSPHNGTVYLGSSHGTWKLPPPY